MSVMRTCAVEVLYGIDARQAQLALLVCADADVSVLAQDNEAGVVVSFLSSPGLFTSQWEGARGTDTNVTQQPRLSVLNSTFE